ncbi:MAG TPA: hypothetical protein VF168_11830 [Trueperaceae bacterium]
MKRATNAHRLAFILILVALTSLAFAAPPEWAQGEPPPFNEEDCVFENGRTICEFVEVTTTNDAAGVAHLFPTGDKCADGSLLYERRLPLSMEVRTTRVVFFGTSRQIESMESHLQTVEEGYAVVGTKCRS